MPIVRIVLTCALATFGFAAPPVLDPDTADITLIGAQPGHQITMSHLSGDFDGDGERDWLVMANLASPLGRTYAGLLYIFWAPEAMSGVVDLATSNAGRTLIFPKNGDYGPYSRVSVGDFNDDGKDDIVLGVSCRFPSFTCVGKAYLIFGTGAFPDTVDLAAPTIPVTTISGSAWDDGWLGAASAAADFNGDSIDDLVISAPFLDGTGTVYVIYGAPSFPPSIDLTFATGGLTRIVDKSYGVGSGQALACSDVDRDGASDILIGAPGNAVGTWDGKVTLLFGQPAPPDTILLGGKEATGQAKLVTDTGVQGTLGASVVLGDFDGDGEDDAAVSAPNASSPSCSSAPCGVVYAVSRVRDLPRVTNLDAPSPSIARYVGGSYVVLGSGVGVGDFDSDGDSDLAMTAWPVPQASNPAVVVVAWAPPAFGETIAVSNNSLVTTIVGKVPDDSFGQAIGAYDVNADGACDLVIGAHRADPLGRNNAGEVYVFWGTGSATAAGPALPVGLAVRAFPNPFSSSVSISYRVPATSEVTFRIYDVRGRLVDTLREGKQPVGTHELLWTPGRQGSARPPAGIYFGRMEAGGHSETIKMLLVR